jgi:hypothetical protein
MSGVIRAACLGLTLAFVAGQSLSWADCCCGALCRHKNTCTGCSPQDHCPGGEKKNPASSCCEEEESAPRKTCSHQEPSFEIDSVSGDSAPALFATMAPLLPIDGLFSVTPDFSAPKVETGPPRAAPGDSLPLHLVLSVLRI